MALAYAGQNFEIREVVLRDKPQSMLDISPKGTVPVLVLHNRVIDESLDIMRYALTLSDPDGWQNFSAELEDLLDSIEPHFKTNLDKYKYNFGPESDRLAFRAACAEFLGSVEARLAQSGGAPEGDIVSFLDGPSPCMVDVALFPFVRQFANVDKPWFDAQPWPKLQAWLEYFVATDLFLSVMHKYPQWQLGDHPIYFS